MSISTPLDEICKNYGIDLGTINTVFDHFTDIQKCNFVITAVRFNTITSINVFECDQFHNIISQYLDNKTYRNQTEIFKYFNMLNQKISENEI